MTNKKDKIVLNETSAGDAALDKILIVDDTPENIDLLHKILTNTRTELFFSNTGSIALDLVPKILPDLILLDVMMPGIDGFETCRQLKNNNSTKDIPVIFITALSDTESLVEAFEAGGVDYITKPFQAEEVIRRVNTHLQIRMLLKERASQIEQLEEMNLTLQKSEALNRAIVDSAAEGIIIVNLAGIIQSVNYAAEKTFGYDVSEIPGKNINQLMKVVGNKENIKNNEQCYLKNEVDISRQETTGIRKDGAQFPVYIAVSEVVINGKAESCTVIVRDITKQKAMELELQKLATEDGLTGVGNRRSFDDYLKSKWEIAYKNKMPLSLIIYDVDFFKPYNDTYGHQAGDDCLKQVAKCAKEVLQGKQNLIARYGGDEFAILLPDRNIKDAFNIAEFLCYKIKNLNIFHEHSSAAAIVTISVGVSSALPDHFSHKREQLLSDADRALYEAKRAGRNQIKLSE